MRKVLLSASAAVLALGISTAAQAADINDADVNIANIAVNYVPGNFGPAIDGSINVSAEGGDIGHQGWHEGRDLGVSETFAAGAVNQTDVNIGRNAASGAFSVDSTSYSSRDSLEIDEITNVHYDEGGFGGAELGYFDVDGVDYWSSSRFSDLDVAGNFAYEGVAATNIVNVALNFESIDGSANYVADGWMSSIGNIGAISTSAIGALNVTTATIGIPGNLGDL
ncbi:hypothetical protein [Aquibaculum sediminis]|uniref:hypothetical protein n=1 Tax=Aquibaculum sediminis TaxID=3231907 RepID=UPI0034560466